MSVEIQIQQAAARNAEIQRVLVETDHAVPALKEQDRFISELEQQIVENDKKMKSLILKKVKEFDDHESYRDSKFRRFLSKSTGQGEKFAAKAEQEEKEYLAVIQEEHEAHKLRESLVAHRQNALNVRSDLQRAKDLHEVTQTELESLYQTIFAGITPEFPREDELERRSDQALKLYHNKRTQYEAEAHRTDLISEALSLTMQASAAIESARGYSRADMLGGGTYSDMMERNNVSQAAALIQQAKNAAARANLSSLPTVDIHQGNLASDMVFDSIFTDAYFHGKIRDSQSQIASLLISLRRILAEAKTKRDVVKTELEQYEKSLEGARTELYEERRSVFEKVAASAGFLQKSEPPAYSATELK